MARFPVRLLLTQGSSKGPSAVPRLSARDAPAPAGANAPAARGAGAARTPRARAGLRQRTATRAATAARLPNGWGVACTHISVHNRHNRKVLAMKTVPRMTTDAEAEAFLDQDLSDLDFTQFRAFVWETAPKTARINMRLPEGLMTAIKARAAQRGIPYQRLIREALEREVGRTGG